MQEIWKDIENYEGYYQVSNLGRVRSVNRIVINSMGGKIQHLQGKLQILKPGKLGYVIAQLSKDNKRKYCKVHRLVAQAFIPNPDNLPEVNHKDENKANNRVDNLEWCDREYNVNYGTCSLRISKANKGRSSKLKGIAKSEETRKRMSAAMVGNKNCLGRKLSDETKKKISDGNKVSQLGKHHTQDTKKKMALSHISLSQNDICDIYNQLCEGVKGTFLAEKYNVKVGVIYGIKNKRGIYGEIINGCSNIKSKDKI